MSRERVHNGGFNFAGELLETRLPVAGATPSARHASASGAQAAAANRPIVALKYWDLFERVGAISDHEAAEILGVGLSTINSTRNKYNEVGVAEPARIVPSGTFEPHQFKDGRTTKRTRWIRADLLDRFLAKLNPEQRLEAEGAAWRQTNPEFAEVAPVAVEPVDVYGDPVVVDDEPLETEEPFDAAAELRAFRERLFAKGSTK